jgi:hypothetical protein
MRKPCTSRQRWRWLITYFGIALDCSWPIWEALFFNARHCIDATDRAELGQAMYNYLCQLSKTRLAVKRGCAFFCTSCLACHRGTDCPQIGWELQSSGNRVLLRMWTRSHRDNHADQTLVYTSTLDGWLDLYVVDESFANGWGWHDWDDGAGQRRAARAPLAQDFRPQLALAMEHLRSCKESF